MGDLGGDSEYTILSEPYVHDSLCVLWYWAFAFLLNSGCPFCQVVGRKVGCQHCSLVFCPQGCVCVVCSLCWSSLRVKGSTGSCNWVGVLNSFCMQKPLAHGSPKASCHGVLSDAFAGTGESLLGSRVLGPSLLSPQQPRLGELCPYYLWCISSYCFGARITSLSRPLEILILSSISFLCFWKSHDHGSFSVIQILNQNTGSFRLRAQSLELSQVPPSRYQSTNILLRPFSQPIYFCYCFVILNILYCKI